MPDTAPAADPSEADERARGGTGLPQQQPPAPIDRIGDPAPRPTGPVPPNEAEHRAGPEPGGDTDTQRHDDVDPAGDEAGEPILEMRQVAGLTAGSVMELAVGSYQFHESETDVGFAVVVNSAEDVTVVPGTAEAHVDEIDLREPTPLPGTVLNVGSACFTVRPHRPPPTNEHRLATIEAARRGPGAIVVPDLVDRPGPTTQARSPRFGVLFDGQEEVDGFDPGWWEFLETVRASRSVVAERHRWLHPDPEELWSRLERRDPGLWDRGVDHPLFGRVALAYATIPWEPRFDRPDHIPPALHGPIHQMSRLPWVPVTANLQNGPLGIAGPRAAVLAATRFVLLSLTSLTAPADLALSIVTAKGLVNDWAWTASLPSSLFPDGKDAFLIAVADGMSHFDGAGYTHEAVLRNEMGLVALGDGPEDLPDYCATTLLLSADGRCQVRNHLGEQAVGTPIGVTADLAETMARSITEALGSSRPTSLGGRRRQAVPAAPRSAAPEDASPDRPIDGPGVDRGNAEEPDTVGGADDGLDEADATDNPAWRTTADLEPTAADDADR